MNAKADGLALCKQPQCQVTNQHHVISVMYSSSKHLPVYPPCGRLLEILRDLGRGLRKTAKNWNSGVGEVGENRKVVSLVGIKG